MKEAGDNLIQCDEAFGRKVMALFDSLTATGLRVLVGAVTEGIL